MPQAPVVLSPPYIYLPETTVRSFPCYCLFRGERRAFPCLDLFLWARPLYIACDAFVALRGLMWVRSAVWMCVLSACNQFNTTTFCNPCYLIVPYTAHCNPLPCPLVNDGVLYNISAIDNHDQNLSYAFEPIIIGNTNNLGTAWDIGLMTGTMQCPFSLALSSRSYCCCGRWL